MGSAVGVGEKDDDIKGAIGTINVFTQKMRSGLRIQRIVNRGSCKQIYSQEERGLCSSARHPEGDSSSGWTELQGWEGGKKNRVEFLQISKAVKVPESV